MTSISDWREVIPDVWLHKEQPIGSTLRRLFPQEFFQKLWEKHPKQFTQDLVSEKSELANH